MVRISPTQMRRLQTLYGQLCSHTDQGGDRGARIQWASILVGRTIASFKDLTMIEAKQLILTLQGQLGIAFSSSRPQLDREEARKAGTEGRRGYTSNERTIVSSGDIARIDYVLALIGWTHKELTAWLCSTSSPLGNRTSGEIRTLYDANRVYWALKKMAVRQGKWKKGRAA